MNRPQDSGEPTGGERRVALVTGASDGMGRATARALAHAGFDLIVVARRGNALDALATELSPTGNEIEVVAADLSTDEGLAEVEDVVDRRAIDVAVLAAGFGTSGPFADADLGNELSMLAVNCGAVLRLSHRLARAMRSRGSGQIVLFGSIVAFQGNAWSAHYSATKAYVQSLAEGLAVELAPEGIKVLSAAPGPVRSGFEARAGMTMGAAGAPEETARAIVASLGRAGTIRPGGLSKLLSYSLAMLPRRVRVRIMSRIMAGMSRPWQAVPDHGRET